MATPRWRTMADSEWEQTCADARRAGIRIPQCVPETTSNQDRMKREIRLLSIQHQLEETNCSDWEEDVYCDIEALQTAMGSRGFSDGERLSLWCVTFMPSLTIVTHRCRAYMGMQARRSAKPCVARRATRR